MLEYPKSWSCLLIFLYVILLQFHDFKTTKSESPTPLKLRLINPCANLTCIFNLLCPKPNSWSHMCSILHLIFFVLAWFIINLPNCSTLISVSHTWFYPFAHLPSSKPTKPIDLPPKNVPNVFAFLHLHPPSVWPKPQLSLIWTTAVTYLLASYFGLPPIHS